MAWRLLIWHSDRRNPQPRSRGPENHDRLRWHWYLHRVHLPHGSSLRGRNNRWSWWRDWVNGRAATSNILQRHWKQGWGNLPLDVRISSSGSHSLLTDLDSLSCASFSQPLASWLHRAEWPTRLPGLYLPYQSELYWHGHRDGGLPVSRFFAKVHPRLDLPLNALYLTVVLVVIFGCIFLGSSRYLILHFSYKVEANLAQARSMPSFQPQSLPLAFHMAFLLLSIVSVEDPCSQSHGPLSYLHSLGGLQIWYVEPLLFMVHADSDR